MTIRYGLNVNKSEVFEFDFEESSITNCQQKFRLRFRRFRKELRKRKKEKTVILELNTSTRLKEITRIIPTTLDMKYTRVT